MGEGGSIPFGAPDLPRQPWLRNASNRTLPFEHVCGPERSYLHYERLDEGLCDLRCPSPERDLRPAQSAIENHILILSVSGASFVRWWEKLVLQPRQTQLRSYGFHPTCGQFKLSKKIPASWKLFVRCVCCLVMSMFMSPVIEFPKIASRNSEQHN